MIQENNVDSDRTLEQPNGVEDVTANQFGTAGRWQRYRGKMNYKTVTEPKTLLLWDGQLARVVGIGNGKTIHMKLVEKPPCEHCGRSYQVDVLESSPLFQEHAEAVTTLQDR